VVVFALKKKDCIISAAKQGVFKKIHKFGMHVPNDVDKARHAIDKENGNTLWADAVSEEMKNLRVAFDIEEGDAKAPMGQNATESLT
jgi:hypothetical protein